MRSVEGSEVIMLRRFSGIEERLAMLELREAHRSDTADSQIFDDRLRAQLEDMEERIF